MKITVTITITFFFQCLCDECLFGLSFNGSILDYLCIVMKTMCDRGLATSFFFLSWCQRPGESRVVIPWIHYFFFSFIFAIWIGLPSSSEFEIS